MKKNWFGGIAFSVIFVAAACLLPSCGAFFGEGNVSISLLPVQQASRAISADLIDDIKGSVTSYRVTVNANGSSTTKSGRSGSFSFAVPVGTKIEITVECLFDEEVMVRAVKTHTVTAGANDIRINLRQDGEV